MAEITAAAQRARRAALALAHTTEEERNAALVAMKEALLANKDKILAANELDVAAAKKQVEDGTMSTAMAKRLSLAGDKFESVVTGVTSVVALPDPLGKVSMGTTLDTGLDLYRLSCPIGVLCIIFESRPDAAVSIPVLAVKSGNAVILKGGKEATNSNKALVQALRDGLSKTSIPVDAVQCVETRSEVQQLLSLSEYIDLVIPRGGKQLVQHVQAAARMPVLGHADGLCTVYVDKDADVDTAIQVVVDSKTQYPAACNALETLLIHVDSTPLLPQICAALTAAGVHLRGCPRTLQHYSQADAATDADYDTEFLEHDMVIKVVDTLTQAITHINQHGSHHTDCIVTRDDKTAEVFMAQVDSASVMHNASTRFADGFRYGFGAEIGISTNKTHARGPVGLEGLTIYKYRLYGQGHKVDDYSRGRRQWRHDPMGSKAEASLAERRKKAL